MDTLEIELRNLIKENETNRRHEGNKRPELRNYEKEVAAHLALNNLKAKPARFRFTAEEMTLLLLDDRRYCTYEAWGKAVQLWHVMRATVESTVWARSLSHGFWEGASKALLYKRLEEINELSCLQGLQHHICLIKEAGYVHA